MTTYQKFRNSSLDTADVGLDVGSETSESVFTPLGARVIGWADAMHFCFVEGFGETVFAVNPAADAANCVHAVARSFPDFLGLICACGGTEAIEQAIYWSRWQFDRFRADRLLTRKQRAILNALRNTYAPPVISDPFQYLLDIHREIDVSAMEFPQDYAEHASRKPGKQTWAVCFGRNFLEPCGKDAAGKEILIGKSLSWGDEIWHIPAVYACKAGLAADYCVEVPPERIDAFRQKWDAAAIESEEQRMKMEEENPLAVRADACLTLNGKGLTAKSSFSTVWNPRGKNSWEAAEILEHYGCDREKGWIFLRAFYIWYRNSKPAIQSLRLTLRALPAALPGSHFRTSGTGESIAFFHPVTGKTHTLTVTEFSQEALDENFLFDLPRNYVRMAYTLSPELPDSRFSVQDCAEGDPIHRDTEDGVIGGADGPTAIVCNPSGSKAPNAHIVCSSLHYAPVEDVEWRMVFHERMRKNTSAELIP